MATTEITGAEEVAWDLSDLYEAIDDPRIDADIEQAEADAAAFRERYHGKVAQLDAGGLAEAVAEYERIESSVVRPLGTVVPGGHGSLTAPVMRRPSITMWSTTL